MSRFDYDQSRRIARTDPSFTSLLMAAMRSDTDDAAVLRQAFPAIYAELAGYYDPPPPPPESSTDMSVRRHIYNYQIPVADHPTALTMPQGATIKFIDSRQPGTITLWAESVADAETEERMFLTVPTGVDIDDQPHYIGTVHDRDFIWHLYEIPRDK